MELIGLQEMQRRIEKPEVAPELRKDIQEMLDHNYFDHEERNIYGTGRLQKEEGIAPLKPADAVEINRSIKNIPLAEFLAKSGTTGIGGAAYLIPTKIHSVLYEPAVAADIVSDISISVLPPEQLPGTTTNVDILVDGGYRVWTVSSGAQMPTETLQTTQATLDFSNTYGINFRIANDLIEDSQWNLIETHIAQAGREIGEKASELACDVLIAGADGDGTLNTEAGGANTTLMVDVLNAYNANLQDGYTSDTYLLSRHVWFDAVMQDTTYTSYANVWHDAVIATNGDNVRLFGMNLIFNENPALAASATTGTAYEDLDSVVFSKNFSLLSGRKRWLRIENYSEPIKDLVGATVTFRQDSVSVYDDSICRIRET